MINNNWYYRNTKNYKIILWTIIYQQTVQSRKNEQVLEAYSLLKLNEKEVDNLNRWNTRCEIESVIEKKANLQTKVQDQMASLGNSTKHTENLHQSFLKSSKRLNRKEHSQSHPMMPPSPWYQNQTKTTLKKKTTGQYHWWTYMQKSLTKF